MAGRSLRPRGEVDYTAKTVHSKTPGWLKSNSQRDSIEHKPQHQKENKKPEKDENDATAASSKAVDKKPGKRGSKGRDNEVPKDKPEQALTKREARDVKKRQRDEASDPNKRAAALGGTDERITRPASESDNQGEDNALEAKATKRSRKSKAGKGSKVKELPGDLTDSSASQAGSKGRAGHASSKAERVSPAKTRSGRTRTGKGEDVQTAVDSEVPEPQPQPQDQTRTAAEPTSQVQNGDAAEPDRAQSDARKAKIAVNAHPAGSQMPSASPVTEQHDNFRALQEEYAALQAKYKDIKAHRIREVEEVIAEIKAQEQAHTKKALQLAAHWEAEAQRQAAIAQHGDIVTLQRKAEQQEAQMLDLQELLVDTQAQVLEKEEEGNELRRKLGELIRLVEQLQEANSEEAFDEEQPADGDQTANLGEEPAPETGAALAHSSPAEASVGKATRSQPSAPTLQVQSVLNNARAVQQRSSGGPISQAVTPASINVPGLMASNDTPVVFQPELSSRATRVGRASTGGVHPWAIVPYKNSVSVNQGAQRNRVQAMSAEGPAGSQEPIAAQEAAAGSTLLQEKAASGSSHAKHRLAQAGVSSGAGIDEAFLQLGKEYTASSRRFSAARPNTGQHVGEAHTNASPAVGRFLSFSPGRTAASQRPQEGLEGSKSPPVASPSLPKAGVTKEASKSAPQADSPSKSPQTLSLGAVSDITNKGLVNLVGLTIAARRPRGGFSYTHPPTGFVFEIVNDDSSDSEDEAGSLVFNPLDFGTAEALLPSYLKYEIKFAPEMRLKLVSRIMDHLGTSSARPQI